MNERWYSVLLSIGVIVGISFLRWAINRIAYNRIQKLKTRYTLRKATNYLSYLIIVLVLLTLWLKEFQSAATFLGLLTAGLAVALRDPIVNFFGWLFIVFNRPFEMGDRIEVGDKKGDVLDVRFFDFILLEIGGWVDANQSTGRIIHVPNGKVFSIPITNFAQGFPFIWHEVPVLLTFDSNWQKAKQLLLDFQTEQSKPMEEVARKLISESEKKYNITYSKLSPVVYTSTKPNGILLTVRFLSHIRQQRANEQNLWEMMLTEFPKQKDIRFAYPSQAIYWQQSNPIIRGSGEDSRPEQEQPPS